MSTVTSLSSLNADHLIKHFGVSSNEKALSGSLRFIFDRALKESDPHLPPQKKHEKALESCIDFTDFRLRMFRENLRGYFPADYPTDLDSLGIAIICDRYVYDVEDLVDEEDKRFFRVNTDVDELFLTRACIIWEEACSILTKGKTGEPKMQESYFLAHIYALEELKNVNKYFDSYDANTLQEILKDMQVWEKFIDEEETFIGLELREQIDETEKRIIPYLKDQSHATQLKSIPRLTLVQPSTPTPTP